MELQFYHVGGACFVITVDDYLTLACDPALSPAGTLQTCKSFSGIRLKPPLYKESLFTDVDLWLITHAHPDHLDEPGIRQISPASTVVAEKQAARLLSACPDLHVLRWKARSVFQMKGFRLEVIAVPAFRGKSWLIRKLTGKINGYFLRITKNGETRTIYITSDTVYHPAVVRFVRPLGKIDIMIANLGEASSIRMVGPHTMSPAMLAKLTNKLCPLYTIPIHLDDFSHYATNPANLPDYGFAEMEQGCWQQLP